MNNFTWIKYLAEYTPAADATITVELGTRPKACLAITIIAANVDATLCTTAELLLAITDLRVTLFGSSFIQLSGADLAVLNGFILKRNLIRENMTADITGLQWLTLVVPFGMALYDPLRGLWGTAPGEAKLEMDVDIAAAGHDGLVVEVSGLEVPDAIFPECLRYTTLTHTPSAAGDSDADLPRVHPAIAYLIYSTTVPAVAVETTTADFMTLLQDRDPEKFLEFSWMTLHGLADVWLQDFSAYTNTSTLYANYSWLPFCPDGNFEDPFDPSIFSDLKLRFAAGDGEAIRIIPIELITPSR